MRPDFYKGVDISFLPQCMDAGMKVRDLDGSEKEPFELLEKYGVNAVRLRIWHTPGNVPESGGYCDFAHTAAMAEEIRRHGMQFMLDFHYSDFWADPGQQRKPKAWEGLDSCQLEEAVYRYTRDTLLALQERGLLPDIVQIGNEIRSGLLFPDGELPDYAGMVRLVNAGIRGARSVAGPSEMQVMIHLDQGGRYFYLKEWFDHALAEGLMDFDLIGLSYYPFWHGTYSDLEGTLARLVEEYGKPVMIVECAYAWRKCENGFIDEAQEKISGFPATPKGQRGVLERVDSITARVPGGMGLGVFYWEPLCLPVNGVGSWAENMGLLDENGQALEGIQSFSLTREEYASLVWEEAAAALPAREEEHGPEGENLLENAGWEKGLEHWQAESSGEHVSFRILSEAEEGCPGSEGNGLRVEGRKNFTFRIVQQVRIEEAGYYCLRAEICGTDTTGVDVRLFVQSGEERKELAVHPTEHGFTAFRTEAMWLEAGWALAGISVAAPPMYMTARGLSFFRLPSEK